MICDKGPLGGLRLLQGEGSNTEISFKENESITVEQKSQQPISRFYVAIVSTMSTTNHFAV